MLAIAAIGFIAGAAIGLLGGIANVTEQNADAAAAAAEATAESAELTAQLDAATDIFGEQQEEFQAQLDAASQAAQFNIGEATIAGERAVGNSRKRVVIAHPTAAVGGRVSSERAVGERWQ